MRPLKELRKICCDALAVTPNEAVTGNVDDTTELLRALNDRLERVEDALDDDEGSIDPNLPTDLASVFFGDTHEPTPEEAAMIRDIAKKNSIDPLQRPCGLTHQDLQDACRNIGFDVTCGNCAGVFYTGSDLGRQHTCRRWGVWFKDGPLRQHAQKLRDVRGNGLDNITNEGWWWPNGMRWEGSEAQAKAAAYAAQYLDGHHRSFEARALP